MYRKLLILSLAVGLSFQLLGQSHYPGYFAVFLKDKNNTHYSTSEPEHFLSERAIRRYQSENIAITIQDLPVNQSYLDSIQAYGADIFSTSKWLNAALIICSDSLKMVELSNYTKIQTVKYLGPYDTLQKKTVSPCMNLLDSTTQKGTDNYGDAYQQFHMLSIPHLHEAGYRGQGVHIAVLDAGFWNTDQMHAFDSLRLRSGILSERDIVFPGNNVYHENTHGSHVLSTMAAFIEGEYTGAAPHASYHLIRTEAAATEYPYEEFHWVVGAELADSLGVDIITSSLSYHSYDDTLLSYTHSDLDGQTALVSIGAQIATEKGIIVLNSAGNDGSNPWKKIGFPADAVDVLTVGAVDSLEKYADLSSVGYTADKRIKPDVVAVGYKTYLVSTQDKVFRGNGTSFSTPIVSGGVALLIQSNPEASSAEIRAAVKQSASQYITPDSLLGYGTPNFLLADMILKNMEIPILEEQESFKVLPNPFRDNLTVIYDAQDTQNVQIAIYDIAGKKVWERNNVFQHAGLNKYKLGGFQGLSDGVYFIRITSESKSYSQKIIKYK